jgi:hypothetical protein
MESYTYTTAHKSIELTNPRMNILIASQPEIAVKFFKNSKLMVKGLLPRVIPIFINMDTYKISGVNNQKYICAPMKASYQGGVSPPQGLVSDPVTERNCVIERWGGEQQEVKERFVGDEPVSALYRDEHA